MQILFDGEIDVAYHSFGIGVDREGVGDDGDDQPELDSRAGQVNGLCGAAIPGRLEFTTGLHTGSVLLRVEMHDTEPGLDPTWQEIVEASFSPYAPGIYIDILFDAPISLPGIEVGDYRVRFCGVGFDNEDDEVTDTLERYLVQLWPAVPGPDRIVRQTSSTAAYWHRVALQTPAPPSAEQRATARAEEQRRRRDKEEQVRRDDEARYWGGRAPANDRLREIAPRAVGLARIDRDLVDEIADLEPQEQRAMAAWAARETCRRAGLADQNWVAQALDALDRGDPPPPWFATFTDGFARWQDISPEQITRRSTISFGPDVEQPKIAPEVSAIHTVVFARQPNALEAALDTVRTAAEVTPGEASTVIGAFRAHFGLPRPAAEAPPAE